MGLNRNMMSGTIVELPTEETFLLKKSQTKSTTTTFTITVPKGVKVVKAYLYSELVTFNNTAYATLTGNKQWIAHSGFTKKKTTVYVGVTPRSTYTISLTTDAMFITECNCTISYSSAINQQTPTVTDY